MKTCPRCGNQNDDSKVNCDLCGEPLAAYPNQQYQQPAQQYQQPAQQQYQPYQPNATQYQQQYPSYQTAAQPAVKRKAPLILGIIGVIFALLLPIVTYCCSIPGLVMANKDIRNGADNRGARVLNIVAIIIAAINSIAGVIMNLSML